MSIVVENDGAVHTLLINRPEVRNAVDGRTAVELADAFREFESDEGARVAVLGGVGGHFCAGADLKQIAAGQPNRIDPEGDGPMGPTRMLVTKPVIAAVNGYAVAGGLELVVRPSRDGRNGGSRHFLPPLGRPPCRRRHHPPAAIDRLEPGARFDIDRSPGEI